MLCAEMLSRLGVKGKHFNDLELLVLLGWHAWNHAFGSAAITASANSSVPALPPTSRVVCLASR